MISLERELVADEAALEKYTGGLYFLDVESVIALDSREGPAYGGHHTPFWFPVEIFFKLELYFSVKAI